MNTSRVIGILVSGLLYSPTLAAETTGTFISGTTLYESCQRNAAAQYVVGVVDGALLAQQFGAEKQFCLPSAATGQQLTDVVCKLMREQPRVRHYSAAVQVAGALAEAFPCPK